METLNMDERESEQHDPGPETQPLGDSDFEDDEEDDAFWTSDDSDEDDDITNEDAAAAMTS